MGDEEFESKDQSDQGRREEMKSWVRTEKSRPAWREWRRPCE